MPSQTESALLKAATDLHRQTTEFVHRMQQAGMAEPSFDVGATTELWTSNCRHVTAAKIGIINLAKDITKLLLGPRGFLHEFVSANWDLGALYTSLEFDIFEKIPLDGQATLQQLAQESGIPEDKLQRILRLNVCDQFIREPVEGTFAHTAISEALVKDEKFKAFIGFQLFETRVSSAHLADSLKLKANDYRTGQSAFKYAWGEPMYEWYKTHKDKSARFDKAMEGVAQSLDPGNALFHKWFESNPVVNDSLVVDVGGGNGHIAKYIAEAFPQLKFSVQDSSETLLEQGRRGLSEELSKRISFEKTDFFKDRPETDDGTVMAYAMRNVLWNWSDEDAVKILRTFIPILKKSPQTVILVNDGISPVYKANESHEEKPYRRRDVTVMTMHNTRQRTEKQWLDLFAQAAPEFKVTLATAYSPHSYRGLWELRWTGDIEAKN